MSTGEVVFLSAAVGAATGSAVVILTLAVLTAAAAAKRRPTKVKEAPAHPVHLRSVPDE